MEEVVLLEEQIISLQADVESLQSRLADTETLAATRETELTRMKAMLADHEAASASYLSETDRLRGEIDVAEERSRHAAGRYRELLLRHEPDLPDDLVSGSTVDEIDAAADRARQTVSQVRQRFEAQALATRVPAGAPARTSRDTSALTPAEKIRLGLRQG